MGSWKRQFLRWFAPIKRNISQKRFQLATFLGRNIHAPIIIVTYRGYASSNRIFLQGRVLKDRFIQHLATDTVWRNIINTFKRVRSYEIQDAIINIPIGEESFKLYSDVEGYFKLDRELNHPLTPPKGNWLRSTCKLNYAKKRIKDLTFETEILFPTNASFGIISDVDDTVIKTDATSLFKWKTIYLYLIKNATTRKAFKEVSNFYRALEKGTTPETTNPFFYVSNSPWNFYDLLIDFLEINNLPKGPVLQRDFGFVYENRPKGYKGHKYVTIRHILKTYPDLPFVLIGDSGEKDAAIYLDITREFPGRIKAIFIRDVNSQKRTRRIRKLIARAEGIKIFLVPNYVQAARLAAEMDLLDLSYFENLAG